MVFTWNPNHLPSGLDLLLLGKSLKVHRGELGSFLGLGVLSVDRWSHITTCQLVVQDTSRETYRLSSTSTVSSVKSRFQLERTGIRAKLTWVLVIVMNEKEAAYETGRFDARKVDPAFKLDERGYVYISADISANVK
jgi:hypothetical protein